MPVELVLLRHGKSDWSVPVDDFHRPLKKRGEIGARRIGQWLGQQQIRFDWILSSPAERARLTAQHCVAALHGQHPPIEYHKRLYHADAHDILQVLQQGDPFRCALVVGHNPGLEDLLRLLCASAVPPAADGKILATASLAYLRFPDHIRTGTAELHALRRARDLSPSNASAGAKRQ